MHLEYVSSLREKEINMKNNQDKVNYAEWGKKESFVSFMHAKQGPAHTHTVYKSRLVSIW